MESIAASNDWVVECQKSTCAKCAPLWRVGAWFGSYTLDNQLLLHLHLWTYTRLYSHTMSTIKEGAKALLSRSKPMKRFPQPVSLPSTFVNTRVMRDHFKRQMFEQHEVTSRALKFIARNSALPQKVRLEAQLQLNALPNYTRANQLRGRCVDSGRGKGVIRDFRLCRYQFRMQALQGLLPGVRKGVW